MEKRKTFLIALCLIAGTVWFQARAQKAQKVRFNPNYSFSDFRIGYGRLVMMDGDLWDVPLVEGHYTHLFWNHLAFRAGGQLALGAPGHELFIGAPVALLYRPGTLSLKDALLYATEQSVVDAAWSGIRWGTLDGLGSSILTNFLVVLFRRTEYFVGLTPAILGMDDGDPSASTRSHFMLTADVGIVFSVPIWRLCLNVSPTYHVALTRNFYYDYPKTGRNFVSLTGGITYLF